MNARKDNAPIESARGPWAGTWARLRHHRAAVGGLFLLVILASVSIAAPWIAPHPPNLQDLALGAAPPSASHWLGTDVLGRDLLARILFGGRVSLAVGLCATFVSLLIGVTYGAVSGYAGGRTDALLMRVVDVLYALPFTVFVIILMVVFGRNIVLMFVAIGAVEWLTMARIVRGQVLAVRHEAFVKAATVLGFSHARVLLRHVLPNVIGPVIVYTTLTVPRVILLEAFLSFLGLGVQPPMSSWGLLIRDGAEMMDSYAWLMIFPGLVLTLTLLSLNFLGDGLRDALDPQFVGKT
jgi:oligopeptide transport system permease protein